MEWNFGMSTQKDLAMEVQDFKGAITFDLGIQFPKGSEFTDFFSYWVARMTEAGILDAMQAAGVFGSAAASSASDTASAGTPIGYESLVFPVACLGFGVAVGFLILIAESFAEMVKRRRQNQEMRKKAARQGKPRRM